MEYDLYYYIGDNEKKNRLKTMFGFYIAVHFGPSIYTEWEVSTCVAFTIQYFHRWTTEGLSTQKKKGGGKSSWKNIHSEQVLINLFCHQVQIRQSFYFEICQAFNKQPVAFLLSSSHLPLHCSIASFLLLYTSDVAKLGHW